MVLDPSKHFRSKHALRSIRHAKALLDVMAAGNWVSLRDLAMMTGLAKTTAFNLVSALVDVGLAERDAKAGAYRLSLQHLSYGKAVERRLDIATVARPLIFIRLCALTRETVNLALPCPTDSLIVESLEGSQTLRVSSYAGTRASYHSTACGRALLAYHPLRSANDLQPRQPSGLDGSDHHRSGDPRSGACRMPGSRLDLGIRRERNGRCLCRRADFRSPPATSSRR